MNIFDLYVYYRVKRFFYFLCLGYNVCCIFLIFVYWLRFLKILKVDLILVGMGGEVGFGCLLVGVGVLLELGFFFLNYNGIGLVCNEYFWNKCKYF